MRLIDLADRRVAIWGSGREAAAAARALGPLLLSELIAVDERVPREPNTWSEQFPDVPLHVGSSGIERLLDHDVVIKSPGISRMHPWFVALRHNNVKVTSGTALWMTDHYDHTIAVTGSKGKSTTSALIHHLLNGAGRIATLTGNIGTPLLDTPETARHVVELSSYQSFDLDTSPDVVVLTRLFPEHLDWHGSENAYYNDKLNIAKHNPRVVVVNGRDDRLVERVARLELTTEVIYVGRPDSYHFDGEWFRKSDTRLFPRSVLKLHGVHNAGNLCLALAVMDALGVQSGDWPRIVETFRGLPHRLELIADPDGRITFVNDSLSTAPQSAIAALEAFEDRPVTLIVGGNDRGLDYGILRNFLEGARSCPTIILAIPDSGPRIAEVLKGLPKVDIEVLDDLPSAVSRAREVTPDGGVVLLSPAAPSYGRFIDHEHRAVVFTESIRNSASSEGTS